MTRPSSSKRRTVTPASVTLSPSGVVISALYSTPARPSGATIGSPKLGRAECSSVKACRAYWRAPSRPCTASRNGCDRNSHSSAYREAITSASCPIHPAIHASTHARAASLGSTGRWYATGIVTRPIVCCSHEETDEAAPDTVRERWPTRASGPSTTTRTMIVRRARCSSTSSIRSARQSTRPWIWAAAAASIPSPCSSADGRSSRSTRRRRRSGGCASACPRPWRRGCAHSSRGWRRSSFRPPIWCGPASVSSSVTPTASARCGNGCGARSAPQAGSRESSLATGIRGPRRMTCRRSPSTRLARCSRGSSSSDLRRKKRMARHARGPSIGTSSTPSHGARSDRQTEGLDKRTYVRYAVFRSSPGSVGGSVGRNDFHSDAHLVAAVDAVHATVCRGQRELLSLIAEVDRRESWRGSGTRDTAHWVSMRYGISGWKAHRWIAAAHALDGLPRLSAALVSGELGLDKVVELTRFASPPTEAGLISWAKRVSCATVRHRADLERRASIEDDLDTERSRFVSWWYFDEGRRRALERAADVIPPMPDERDCSFAPARRADALVALCSARIAGDADQDRATVVVHAQLDGIERGAGGCEIDGGPVVHPQTVRRLLCNARVQTVLEDRAGNVLGLGRTSRQPSAWMLRQVRYRDRACRSSACGARRC